MGKLLTYSNTVFIYANNANKNQYQLMHQNKKRKGDNEFYLEND